jgi:putative flavoprotein involved in K+ transport
MADLRDILIIGGGQMGLSLGYYLRRAGIDFQILDAEAGPGGAWRHGWDSLHLFSPAGYSSLPGWLMPIPAHKGYPTRDDLLDYLARYESRYSLPIERPVQVEAVERVEGHLEAVTDRGRFVGRIVVSATGTWSHPFIPAIAGRETFGGVQLHSADYVRPDQFAGQTVLIVGGGNSGAQILAEVSQVAATIWVTQNDPLFLPDEVDGRVLFERATARLKAGPGETPVGGIGDIVMVPPVREARARDVLHAVRPFDRMTQGGIVWPDGSTMAADAIIWCTGFRAALGHLASLGVVEESGRVVLHGQQSIKEPALWLAGYGDWSGAGSATLIGAARTARDLTPQLEAQLSSLKRL